MSLELQSSIAESADGSLWKLTHGSVLTLAPLSNNRDVKDDTLVRIKFVIVRLWCRKSLTSGPFSCVLTLVNLAWSSTQSLCVVVSNAGLYRPSIHPQNTISIENWRAHIWVIFSLLLSWKRDRQAITYEKCKKSLLWLMVLKYFVCF